MIGWELFVFFEGIFILRFFYEKMDSEEIIFLLFKVSGRLVVIKIFKFV